MKKLILIVLVAQFVFSSCTHKTESKEEVSTYYLIRHAEKDLSDKTNRNPDLTEEGLQRAKNWAKHFKDIKFDAVYSSNTIRTKKTALPTAKANQIELQLHNPNDINIEEFKIQTKGKTVLIVGHSNTTPTITNRLFGGHDFAEISEDNYSNLYIVTLTKDSKNVQLSVVPSLNNINP